MNALILILEASLAVIATIVVAAVIVAGLFFGFMLSYGMVWL